MGNLEVLNFYARRNLIPEAKRVVSRLLGSVRINVLELFELVSDLLRCRSGNGPPHRLHGELGNGKLHRLKVIVDRMLPDWIADRHAIGHAIVQRLHEQKIAGGRGESRIVVITPEFIHNQRTNLVF